MMSLGALLNIQMDFDEAKLILQREALQSISKLLGSTLWFNVMSQNDINELVFVTYQMQEWGWRLLDDVRESIGERKTITWDPLLVQAILFWIQHWASSTDAPKTDTDILEKELTIMTCISNILSSHSDNEVLIDAIMSQGQESMKGILNIVALSFPRNVKQSLLTDDFCVEVTEAFTLLRKSSSHVLVEIAGQDKYLETLCPLQNDQADTQSWFLDFILAGLHQEAGDTLFITCLLLLSGNLARGHKRSLALCSNTALLERIVYHWSNARDSNRIAHSASGALANFAIPEDNKQKVLAKVVDLLPVYLDPQHDMAKFVQSNILNLIKNIASSTEHPGVALMIMQSKLSGQSILPRLIALWSRTDDQTLRIQVARIFVMLLRNIFSLKNNKLQHQEVAFEQSISEEALQANILNGFEQLQDVSIIDALCHMVCYARQSALVMSEGFFGLALLAHDLCMYFHVTDRRADQVFDGLLKPWPGPPGAFPVGLDALCFALDEMPSHVAQNAQSLWMLLAQCKGARYEKAGNQVLSSLADYRAKSSTHMQSDK